MALLEICVDSVAGLEAAVAGGADRIELCAALVLGGLSPPLSLLQAARQVPVPVHVMVRPRAGDFLYSAAELAGMAAEIAQVRQMGLAGAVLGAGSGAGLDWPALERLCAAARGLDVTLHRVVDLLPDRQGIPGPAQALGVRRILTSGGAATAMEGIDDIACLVRTAPPGLSVMPGAGVDPGNVAELVARTGATEIHASAAVAAPEENRDLLALGFAPDIRRAPKVESVRALKAACG
ncbi:copper homeostasis protein [Cribrihabitans marinus]|uniref:PF03932 family protein CutC n=1 Tax=Cribrihabitans marinus TaxID=1227549 RepID=A0A1H7D1W6_9RHOB|nr:copper homeostasis protein CutC [Cribrihabitans marinus]GGH37468.1 copper homeostasis protein CutC [Cribrihabitans marinus]SEJ95771.1 copper homeostasis protein [Cribrihabitans marinus]